MSLREAAAITRRRWVVFTLVFILTAGVAYSIKRTPPMYAETGTAVFTAPKSPVYPNPYSSWRGDLPATAYIMTEAMLDAQSQDRVRAAGGTADFSLAPVNLSNEEYPNYGTPYVTLTTTSVDPADAHRTFTIVASSFEHLVSARQAQAGVLPGNRISTSIIGNTGPLLQAGSPKRVYAGLAVLAVVAASMLSSFLSRHQGRLRAIRPTQGARHRAAQT